MYSPEDPELAAAAWETAIELGRDIEARRVDIYSLDEDSQELLRETALVNLWFYLRYVASYSGPYNELSPTLHAEMCNFRQRALEPGSKFAGFVPRSSLKSSIWTHGAMGWELIRDPNLRIGVYGSAIEISLPFMKLVQRMFDSNELVQLLFPETTPQESRNGTWNDKFAIMPSRSRHYPEPSIRAYSAAGTTASTHVDLAQFDDIVSEKELTAGREASAEMRRRRDWLPYAISTLLKNATRSRVLVVGTRYDLADPYEQIMADARERYGDWSVLDQWYPVAPSGAWSVYYRSARAIDENGCEESISPEKYPIAFLDKLAKAPDKWPYIMQYLNNPRALEKIEFGAYSVGKAKLGLDEDGSRVIQYMGPDGFPIEENLADCDLVIGGDPGASERRVNAATSRTAFSVVAGTPRGKAIILAVVAGYYGHAVFMDKLFETHARFSPHVRLTSIELAGPFKFLEGSIRTEEARRQHYLNFVGQAPLGDKLGTIRAALEPLLRTKSLLVVEESYSSFMAEFGVFPSAALDVLDATKIALKHMVFPEVESEYDDDEDSGGPEPEYAYSGIRHTWSRR